MNRVGRSGEPSEQSGPATMRQELDEETLTQAIVGVGVAGFLVVAAGAHFYMLDPGLSLGALLIGLAVLARALRRRSHTVAVWTLVLGCLVVGIASSAWLGLGALAVLLAVPAALAAILNGMRSGVMATLMCTLLLIVLPPSILPAADDLRTLVGVSLWITLGLVWLTSRTWLTTLQWSWNAYEQNSRLLERSQDTQVQLSQTLAELKEANTQLTRLNYLAQGLREAAEASRHAKEQFVANVSHELRTPLNMIIGFAEVMVEAPGAYVAPLPGPLLADLDVVLRNARHLSSLVDDVLDLSQLGADRMALVKERVPLSGLIADAILAVRPLFQSKGLRMEIAVPGNLPALLCDPTRIRQVLLNLLSNAGRFTDRGGVTLEARQEASDLIVSVADTGPGIAMEQQDRLFKPFEQLDSSIARRHGGTGLGLAISKRFVELHGGRMWLESQSGQGTTFYFSLPVDLPEPLRDAPARWLMPDWEYRQHVPRGLAPNAHPQPRLVVCERGSSLRRLIQRHREGVEIVAAGTLAQAREELARAPSRALLVNDAQVGDVLAEITASPELPFGVPAIICSMPGASEAADELGVAEYLVKPISREALLRAVERLDLKGKRILVVDDEPEARRLLWRMLTTPELGCSVSTAANGAEALQILKEHRPDCLLLDLAMPEMDGHQLLAALKAELDLSRILVMLISARDPSGQTSFTHTLAITRQGGLSMAELLACMDTVIGPLEGPGNDPATPAAPPG